MANSLRILVISVLGFLTILATTMSTTQVQASSLSMFSSPARRLLSTSTTSSESESPPYNSPTIGSKPSPDNNMPPLTMPPSPRRQSTGGMKPKKFGKGSCKSWRQKLGQVQKLISTLGSIAKVFKGNSNNNNNNKDYGNNNKNSNNKYGGYYSDMTVMDALMSDSNDGYISLAREGITSLLNAYAYQGFAYTPDQVRILFNEAYYGSTQDVAKQATLFQRVNEQLL